MSDASVLPQAIESALTAAGASVTRVTPVSWECAGRHEATARVVVTLAPEWLLFDASVGDGVDARADWHLLASNALLPHGVKLALTPGAPALRVRAEIPVVDEVDWADRVAGVWAAYVVAWGADHAGWNPSPSPSPREGAGRGESLCRGGDGASGAADLAGLCGATRWPFNARDDGTLAVPLEVNGAFQQAAVTVDAADGVVVRTPVLEGAAPGPGACRDALALLLLRACGVFRMARAAVDGASGAVRFEVVLGTRPTSEELARALSALSVAWRLAAREARVLATDTHVAAAYLAGWASTARCQG